MADTRPIVGWSFEFVCKLRPAGMDLYSTWNPTPYSRAREYSRALLKGIAYQGICEDVYVTSYTSAKSVKDGVISFRKPYPTNGYLISREFESLGGIESLRAMCGSCPANLTPSMCGGCRGSLWELSNPEETDDQLRTILDRLNLRDEYEQIFLKTDPLWYGLWARSPLIPRALQILRAILTEVLNEDRARLAPRSGPSTSEHLERLEALIRATEMAEQNNLKLDVFHGAPGHTDLGIYTVFPHCPVCKADARLPRWQHKYTTEPHRCEVCGTVYSPAATASSEEMDFHEGENLRELLGQAEFENFAKKYLIAHGAAEKEAIDMVALAEKENGERLEKVAEHRRKGDLQRRYIEETLCQGIERSSIDGKALWPAKFKADAFAEVLRRCKISGVEIISMIHEAAEFEDYRYTSRIVDPEEVFLKWRGEDCDGLFSAAFRVPEDLFGA